MRGCPDCGRPVDLDQKGERIRAHRPTRRWNGPMIGMATPGTGWCPGEGRPAAETIEVDA